MWEEMGGHILQPLMKSVWVSGMKSQEEERAKIEKHTHTYTNLCAQPAHIWGNPCPY